MSEIFDNAFALLTDEEKRWAEENRQSAEKYLDDMVDDVRDGGMSVFESGARVFEQIEAMPALAFALSLTLAIAAERLAKAPPCPATKH